MTTEQMIEAWRGLIAEGLVASIDESADGPALLRCSIYKYQWNRRDHWFGDDTDPLRAFEAAYGKYLEAAK